MALRRRTPEPVEEPAATASVPAPRAIVAAASRVRLEDTAQQVYRIADKEWQSESWRHYDMCGEFRFAAGRHASAVSRCRLVIVELDELGRPGKEATDKQVQVLAETIFGGAANKAEAMRTIATQLYVAGECYIVALSRKGPGNTDLWFVASPKELRKKSGSRIEVQVPSAAGGGWFQLRGNADLLGRIWSPHARLSELADAPARAVLPVLRQIERITQLTFSQIDSRLISAGILLFPEGLDFPKPDGNPGGVQGLQEMVLDAARLQLTGAGTAAGLVPIMATIPAADADHGRVGNLASSFAHIKFDTPLQGELGTMMDQAIRRLALGLDIAPEDLLGQGGANHWSAWAIEESSIKMFVEPVLVRICGALTQVYLRAALKALKLDPDKYLIWYDTSPLTVRPNRFEDASALHKEGALSDEALLTAGNFDLDDLPKGKDRLVWLARQAVAANPSMLSSPVLAELLGFSAAQAKELHETIPGAAPVQPEQGVQEQQQPEGQDAGRQALDLLGGDSADTGTPPEPTSRTSPAAKRQTKAPGQFALDVTADPVMLAAAEQAVLHALSVAGSRLLDRTLAGRYRDVGKFALHTRVAVRDAEHAERLLAGSFAHVEALAERYSVDSTQLAALLRQYCAELLLRGREHSGDLLGRLLVGAGLP